MLLAPIFVLELTGDPPLGLVYQPVKVWPFLVVLHNVPYDSPYLTVRVLGLHGVPPWGSNVNVYDLGTKRAWIVVLWSSILVLELTLVPPLDAVYQPVNVFPVIVGVHKVP